MSHDPLRKIKTLFRIQLGYLKTPCVSTKIQPAIYPFSPHCTINQSWKFTIHSLFSFSPQLSALNCACESDAWNAGSNANQTDAISWARLELSSAYENNNKFINIQSRSNRRRLCDSDRRSVASWKSAFSMQISFGFFSFTPSAGIAHRRQKICVDLKLAERVCARSRICVCVVAQPTTTSVSSSFSTVTTVERGGTDYREK